MNDNSSGQSNHPVRSQYRHVKCGNVTDIDMERALTFAHCPWFYKRAWCDTCKDHFYTREGENWGFFWTDGGSPVGATAAEEEKWRAEHPEAEPPTMEVIARTVPETFFVENGHAGRENAVGADGGSDFSIGNEGNSAAAAENEGAAAENDGEEGWIDRFSDADVEKMARAAAIYQRTVMENPYIRKDLLKDGRPHPRQTDFLMQTETLEVFYGGAVGGGKTASLLMAALQFVETPRYAALILRNSFRDLNQPGSLIPVSKTWLMNYGGTKWNARDRRWTFPSGATITFGYLERYDDVLQYRSSEFQTICWDELTLFGEEEYLYLFSRLRKTKNLDVPLRMRSASNPGGKGAAWVRERFILPSTRKKEVLFISAKIDDNPSLSREEYEKNLRHLDPVTRRQLMDGDWEASQDGRFKMAWFKNGRFKHDPFNRAFQLCDQERDYGGPIALNRCTLFVTVDLAASVRTSGDYTVFMLLAMTPGGQLLVLDVERKKYPVDQTPYALKKFCDRAKSTYDFWPVWCGIEANGMQVALANACRQQEGMIPVRYLRPANADKLARANKAIIMAEQGQIFLPISAGWLDDFLYELIVFTGDPKKDSHDDQVDALAYACISMQDVAFESPSFAGRAKDQGRDAYADRGRMVARDGMTRVWNRDGRMRRLFGN